jgi:hypothetical protein
MPLKRLSDVTVVCALFLAGVFVTASPSDSDKTAESPPGFTADQAFLAVIDDTPDAARALEWIRVHWDSRMFPYVTDAVRFTRPARRAELGSLLNAAAKTDFQPTPFAWGPFIWNRPYTGSKHYADFKRRLYGRIDPKFAVYFSPDRRARIRFDEIVWGGVVQDGIPPLRSPQMISAADADYLADTDVVFGISIGDDTRAYPKRILAWHEMFTDKVGGVDVAGIYCTLCGSVILLETEFDGTRHVLGTSGFLYRSNKLMYDRATSSLWQTMSGEPVVGPLVGQGIRLRQHGVVTTTWGEWRTRHPETTVLSLETGHRRDYGEGVAYRDYFATDRLMFPVPRKDSRLRNKNEALALRFGNAKNPLAIDIRFLAERTIYHGSHGGVAFVVLTDKSGANRVYERSEATAFRRNADGALIDRSGAVWQETEEALASSGKTHRRLVAHRAFWFGWQAAYPETELIC